MNMYKHENTDAVAYDRVYKFTCTNAQSIEKDMHA